MATKLGTVIQAKKVGKTYHFYEYFSGQEITEPLEPVVAPWNASYSWKQSLPLEKCAKATGEEYWRKLDENGVKKLKTPTTVTPPETPTEPQPIVEEKKVARPDSEILKLLEAYKPYDANEIKDIVESAVSFRPADIFISDVKWKYLVHSVLRGKPVMMVGDSGAGKTVTAIALAKVLHRNYEIFNMGAMQDARASLIGNTHVNGDGTYFDESLFIKTMRVPGSILVLDEFTRGSHDSWNMLVPTLDPNQRYLRLDEKDGQETVMVADGVGFISTANIGRRYTSTKMLDDAVFERFVSIEMDVLDENDEAKLLAIKYPSLDIRYINALAKIAHFTREEAKSENSGLEKYISTRMNVNAAELIRDGFSMTEAFDACIYPFFTTDGGADSERTKVTIIAQKDIIVTPTSTTANTTKKKKPLFDPNDIAQAVS